MPAGNGKRHTSVARPRFPARSPPPGVRPSPPAVMCHRCPVLSAPDPSPAGLPAVGLSPRRRGARLQTFFELVCLRLEIFLELVCLRLEIFLELVCLRLEIFLELVCLRLEMFLELVCLRLEMFLELVCLRLEMFLELVCLRLEMFLSWLVCLRLEMFFEPGLPPVPSPRPRGEG